MVKLETSGHKAWWPMLQQISKGVSIECYRNMDTGEEYVSEKGWNGEPPSGGSGIQISMSANKKYLDGYDKIKWD